MTSLGGGAYSKGIYYGRWSVRHTNFAATLRQEGAYSKGGAYMLVYTVSGLAQPWDCRFEEVLIVEGAGDEHECRLS
jgi:hypothetical protein